MPEWYFLVAVLGGLAALGLAWSPLLLTVPIFIMAWQRRLFKPE